MQTIVFLGCNKSGTSREALHTSTQMGYYTILLTNRRDFMKKREEFPEVHEMIMVETLHDEEFIVRIIKGLEKEDKQILTVMSFIDPYVSLAVRISEKMGLVKLSHSALSIMEDKIRFREHLKHLPISPKYAIFPCEKPINDCIAEYMGDLPLILKAPASNGSKDVLLARTIPEMREGLQYFRKKFPNMDVLAEEYVIGSQYLIEVMVHNGEILIAAVIEQEIQKRDRFIVTGYHYPALLDQMEYEHLMSAVVSIIRVLELNSGTCHLEMRLGSDGWKLIEINPRMSGGAMNRIILEGTGINLVKETIKLFLGEEPSIKQTVTKHVYAKFLTINSRGKLIKVTGKNRALTYSGVKEVYVKPKKGAILKKPLSLGDRYAYVIAAADTRDEAKKIATLAAKEIKFYLEPF